MEEGSLNKFSVISDLHIRSAKDDAYPLLLSFLNSEEVKKSQDIYLLGDIFDYMAGGHREYLTIYKDFFDLMAQRLKEKKRIFYIEGNHDLHLSPLFNKFFEKYKLNKNYFYLEKNFIIKKYRSDFFFFCHGDHIEIGNFSHKLYRFLIHRRFFLILFDSFFNYEDIEKIGKMASEKSRSYHNLEDYKKLEKNYSESAFKAANHYSCKTIICGHSHIKQLYKNEQGITYANCGYPPESKSFLHFSGDHLKLIPIFRP